MVCAGYYIHNYFLLRKYIYRYLFLVLLKLQLHISIFDEMKTHETYTFMSRYRSARGRVATIEDPRRDDARSLRNFEHFRGSFEIYHLRMHNDKCQPWYYKASFPRAAYFAGKRGHPKIGNTASMFDKERERERDYMIRTTEKENKKERERQQVVPRENTWGK